MDFRTDPRWERFISSHPDALIYHHPGWLLALEKEYGQRCISLACVDQSDRLCAVLPLFPTRGLPFKLGRTAIGRRLSGLPRTPVAGPLATHPAAASVIVKHAIEIARAQGDVQLEIKTQIPDLDQLAGTLACTRWRDTYVKELPSQVEGLAWELFRENTRQQRGCASCQGCRRLRFGNARSQHRVNWSVNKAVKLGLAVREASEEQDLAHWYELYLLTMRHNAVPPRSYRFFQSLWSLLHPTGKMRLLLAEQHQNSHSRMVAGSILLQFGQTVFYAFTGCAPEDLRLYPHDILQMECIRAACRDGFRWYDFGEVTEDHESLAQFKTKWGGDPMPLYRYYHPARIEQTSEGPGGLTSLTRRIWRSLPVRTTAVLGDLIYGRM